MKNGIYVVSKVRHAEMWRVMRERGLPIISSWIDDGLEAEIDFSEAWPRYLTEAAEASFVIVYAQPDEILKGGLLELGAALAQGAHAFIVGDIAALRTVRYHRRMRRALSVQHAVTQIQEITGVYLSCSTQTEIAHWVEGVFGTDCLYNMIERGERVGEETFELMQAIGIPRERINEIADYVYSRPVGVVEQEIAGVGTTIHAFAHAWGVSFANEVEKELARVQALPIEHFRNKRKEKVAAGISMLPSEPSV